MSLSSERMFVTWAGWTGRRDGSSTVTDDPTVFRSESTLCAFTRSHSFGPEAARNTSWPSGSVYQSTLMFNHGTSPFTGPVTTAGWKLSGDTSSAPATSNTVHWPVVATARRSGWALAWASASGEKAM